MEHQRGLSLSGVGVSTRDSAGRPSDMVAFFDQFRHGRGERCQVAAVAIDKHDPAGTSGE